MSSGKSAGKPLTGEGPGRVNILKAEPSRAEPSRAEPSRAEPPSRRAAEPPSRRAAEPPSRPTCVGVPAMNMVSWLRGRSCLSSPPDASSSAGRGAASRRPASSSDRFDSLLARAATGGLRLTAATLLLGLTLLAGFAADARAGILTISAPEAAPSTRSAMAERSRLNFTDLVFQVRLTNAVSAQVPFQVCFATSGTADLDAGSMDPTEDYQPLLGTNTHANAQADACVTSFIAAGHTAPSSAQTVGIRVNADNLIELDETVTATLSLGADAPWDVGLGTREATHTILNDDTEVEFGESTIEGREGGRVRIPVVLNHKLPHSVTVRFTYTGSATKWTDYDASNTSLTFRRGQTRGDLYVNLPDDSDFDDNEGFAIDIDDGNLPAGIQAGSTNEIRVTIKDNDYTIRAPQSTTADESTGGGSIKVTINPAQERPVGVRVSFQGITATAGVDYLQEHHSFPDGVVKFRAGETEKWIYIPTPDDGVHENTELFGVTLTQEDGPQQTVMLNVVIRDYQPGEGDWISRLKIAVDGTDTVREGQTARFKLTMNRPLQNGITVAVGLAQKSDDGSRSEWVADAPKTHAHYEIVEFVVADSEKILEVPIANDGRDTNGSLEAVLMQPGLHPASSGPFSLYSGATSSAKVQIRDGSDGLRSPSTDPAVEVPDTQVANVQASAVDATSATVTWDAVPHATSYQVEWDGEGQQFGSAGALPGVTGTTATVPHDAPEAMTLTIKVIPAYIDGNGATRLLNDLAGTATLDVAPAAACVSDAQWNTVEGYYASNSGKAPNYGRNWYRVLIAYGQERTDETLPSWQGATARPTTAYTVAEARTSETVWSGWTPVREVLECVEAAHPPPPAPLQASDPELSLSAGPDVDEGDGATFTVHADPAPQSDLTVRFTVAQSGDWLDAPGAGSRTVTLPAGAASADLTVATVDDGTDEPDGSVSVTVDAGDGYTVAASPDDTASVAVADDDTAANAYAALIAKMYEWRNDSQWKSHKSHTDRWDRALLAFGESVSDSTLVPMTAAQAQAFADRGMTRWVEVAKALHEIESGGTVTPDPVPAVAPELSLSAGSAVDEGGDAQFTLTANPAPQAALTVKIAVAQSGEYLSTPEPASRTVTLTAGATSTTLSLATTDDGTDEPDGSVSIMIEAGTGYTVAGGQESGTVAVADNDPAPAVPVVSIAGGTGVTEGDPASFTLTADPAPAAPLTVALTIGQGGDYAAGATGAREVIIPTGGSVTLEIATDDDEVDEADGSIRTTLDAGAGYTVAASPNDTAQVAVADNDEPVVSIAAGPNVTEGDPASFTVTASPVPAAPLTITLTVSQGGDYTAGATGAREVIIPTGGSVTVDIATEDDEVDEPDGSVTVTLAPDGEDGLRYTVADAPNDTAQVTVTDNDAAAGAPSLSVEDAQANENEGRLPVILRLNPPSKNKVTVWLATRESDPVSAREGVDYRGYGRWGIRIDFRPGETERRFAVRLLNDSHDEDAETFEVVLMDPGGGAVIADGVGVMTIVNSDPMPAAWLSRFGRTVAQQVLDGIANRMAAPRTQGAQGTIAGQTITFGTEAGAEDPGRESGAVKDKGALHRTALTDPPSRVPTDLAPAFATSANPLHQDGFGQDPQDMNSATRTLTVQDLLLGSSFTATGGVDASGATLAFWGRAARSSFEGHEGTFSLDGETTTALLGADYARGPWLFGLTLTHSEGDGDYRDIESTTDAQECGADTDPALCGGAVREGDGEVEASLTAVIPYVALQATQRTKLWGAVGRGEGDVELDPEPGGSLKSDIDWTMVAAGLRSELLSPVQAGPALALTSDALWARTESDRTHELASSDSEVTRVRLGLEGSYSIALDTGGQVIPKIEVGARHDGGDAETGTGLEIGAGLSWSDPHRGLHLDLSGRTLITHAEDDLEDEGVSVSFSYDPRPDSARGLSLTLHQEMGGPATGGLDALFAPDPLSERTGSEQDARLRLEAAYGLAAGPFIASPHVGLGMASGARDYVLGWRLTPAAPGRTSEVFLEVKGTRLESDGAPPVHTLGVEATLRW